MWVRKIYFLYVVIWWKDLGILVKEFVLNKSNILRCVEWIQLHARVFKEDELMILEEVKDELNKLCTDYLNILQQLKDQEIINEETFKMCSINKKSFLEEK